MKASLFDLKPSGSQPGYFKGGPFSCEYKSYRSYDEIMRHNNIQSPHILFAGGTQCSGNETDMRA